MLYEMLTSRPPFESSNTMGIFAMHLATPPPPLSQAAPGLALPAVLEQLLQQGLAKEPASRIPSAENYEQRIAELLKLDWARLPAAPPPGPARPARARSGISAAQQQQASPGTPIADGRLRAAWRFVIRSRSTLVTVVLVMAGAIGLLYWVARDLVLGG
jgi:serine/threonine protein kinase